MKIKASCGFGFAGAHREEVLELPDDYDDQEIDDEVWAWASNYLDYGWEAIDE